MTLKTMLAAAAVTIGMLAHGALPSGTSFETLSAGATVGKTALEAADTGATWTLPADQTVTAWGDEIKPATRPKQFVDAFEAQENYLGIKTTLGEYVKRNVGLQTIGTSGLYVDTLVKFTAADEDIAVPSDAKIGVWVKTNEEETENRLMISAGPWNDGAATVYECNVLKAADAWKRLTVKAIYNIDGEGSLGFVVYVDGEALDSAAAKTAFAGKKLTPNAAKFAINGNLFPSISNSDQLSEIAVSGQGGIDDISFTDVAPDFAKDFEFITVTFNTDKIATLHIGDETFTTSPASILKTDGLTYWYEAKAGYISQTTPVELTADITIDDPAVAAFSIGSTSYATWADAVGALNGEAKITLVANYTMTETDLTASINNTGLTTLDLNGKSLTGNVAATTALVLTNSVDAKTEGVYTGKVTGNVAAADTLVIYGGYIGGEASAVNGGLLYGGQYTSNADDLSLNGCEAASGFVVQEVVAGTLWEVVEITTTYVAEIGEKQYETFAEAFAAAADGDTITLLDNATTDVIKKFKNNLTINLGGFTLTADLAADSKYIFQILKDLNVTFKNGKIAVAAAKTSLTTVFQNYANLTVENVEIDAANLTGSNAYWNCAAVFAIMNGNVQITGNTSIKNNNGYAISIGNHAGDYPSRAVTINTTGTLDGDFLFAGGTVTYTAGSFASDAKYYYGLAVQATNDVGTVTNGSMFAGSDLVNFPIVAGVGAPVVYPDPATKTAYYEKLGQLFATVADANAAIGTTTLAKNIIVLQNATADALSVASGTVNVVIPADVTLTATTSLALNGAKVALAEGGTLVAPAALTIASDFVAPATGKEIKVAGEGPYTYTVGDAAPQGLKPGESIGLGNPGSMTLEQAQAEAAKLPIVLTADDTAAGLTTESLCVKAVLIGGAYQAVVDVKPELAPAVDAKAETPIEVGAANFSATVSNPVKGLYYYFTASATVDGTYAPAGDAVRAGDAGVTLTAPKGGAVNFYKLNAAVRPPVVK